jgi:hypothetical protein
MAFYRASSFQIPDIHRYSTDVQRVGLTLFQHAGIESYKLSDTEIACFPIPAKKLGTKRKTVSAALRFYEDHGYIRRDKIRFQEQKITFLNPATKEQMRGTDRHYGFLSCNGWTNRESFQRFITVPTARVPDMLALSKNPFRTYMSALFWASVYKQATFKVTMKQLMEESGLSAKAFRKAWKLLVSAKLLNYEKEHLTVVIPERPAKRKPWNGERLSDKTTAEQDLSILRHVLPNGFVFDGLSGWTKRRVDNACPFCSATKTFAVNIEKKCFKCHSHHNHQDYGCGEKGKLFKLVKHFMGSAEVAETYYQCALQWPKGDEPLDV